jgi:AcrR family transcriptional regulator
MTRPAVTPPAPTKRTRRRASRGSGEQLHAEIIAATKELLAESASSDAVSIRSVADAVGVTSPSIYLHFADKEALIEAVVADVFAELDAAMVAAAGAVDKPLEKLCAFGLAYVQFAIEHPEHYRIATMGQGGTAKGAEAGHLDHVLADSAFTHFMSTVADCMSAGIFAAGDPVPVTLELWAAAHGIASLMVAKPFLPWGDKMKTANDVLRAAALGHAVNDLMGGDMTPAEVDAWLARQRKRR